MGEEQRGRMKSNTQTRDNKVMFKQVYKQISSAVERMQSKAELALN